MGIRTLHRRTAHAHADAAPLAPPPPPVSAFAPAASTARIPTDLAAVLRRATATVPADLATTLRRATTAGTARIPDGLATALRAAAAGTRRRIIRRDRDAVRAARAAHAVRQEREAPVWRLWADLGRSYLALVLTLLLRSRPMPTFTVFTAVSERRTGAPPRPRPHRRTPGPDATP